MADMYVSSKTLNAVKYLYLSCCLIFTTLCHAQVFNQFDAHDSRWFVAESYANANMENPSFVQTKTTVYGLNGDTLIGGHTWHKIFSADNEDLNENSNFQGFVRSVDNLVLYRNANNNVTDTLYNFDLSVGDSVWFEMYNFSINLPVESVDSVLINGELVKRIKFAEPIGFGFFTFDEQWIEGVGSIHGPLFPANARLFSEEIPDSLMLTCSKSNDELYWHNPFYDGCLINIILGLKEPLQANIDVYPNPVSDILTIGMSHTKGFFIAIYSIQGQFIYSEKFNSKNTKIDVSNWASGVYFLHLTDGDKATVKRIVKQ